MSDDTPFDQQVINTVRSHLERLMAETDSLGDTVLTPQNTGEGKLDVNQIYWACVKLHEDRWLGRPLLESGGVRVTWNPARHIWYD